MQFVLKTAPHPRFSRDGNNLHMDMNISLVREGGSKEGQEGK